MWILHNVGTPEMNTKAFVESSEQTWTCKDLDRIAVSFLVVCSVVFWNKTTKFKGLMRKKESTLKCVPRTSASLRNTSQSLISRILQLGCFKIYSTASHLTGDWVTQPRMHFIEEVTPTITQVHFFLWMFGLLNWTSGDSNVPKFWSTTSGMRRGDRSFWNSLAGRGKKKWDADFSQTTRAVFPETTSHLGWDLRANSQRSLSEAFAKGARAERAGAGVNRLLCENLCELKRETGYGSVLP